MARKTITRVALILDKSGSMSPLRDATIGGVNEYLSTLKGDKESNYKVSLTLFDTTVEKLWEDLPVKDLELKHTNYSPMGGTALYDAVCGTIKALKKDKKNKKVIIAIMTDGEENSSREFTEDQMASCVKECSDLGWAITYLGANQDAWAKAKQWGFSAQNVANYNATDLGTRAVFRNHSVATMSFSADATASNASFYSKAQIDDIESTK